MLADANVVCHFGARECWLVSGLSCAPILFLCSFVGFVSVNWSHPSLMASFSSTENGNRWPGSSTSFFQDWGNLGNAVWLPRIWHFLDILMVDENKRGVCSSLRGVCFYLFIYLFFLKVAQEVLFPERTGLFLMSVLWCDLWGIFIVLHGPHCLTYVGFQTHIFWDFHINPCFLPYSFLNVLDVPLLGIFPNGILL